MHFSVLFPPLSDEIRPKAWVFEVILDFFIEGYILLILSNSKMEKFKQLKETYLGTFFALFFHHDTCAITINRCRRHHFYFAFVVQGSSSLHVCTIQSVPKDGKKVQLLLQNWYISTMFNLKLASTWNYLVSSFNISICIIGK